MLGKRMHNTKASGFVRANGKGKDILSKSSSSRYNKSPLSETIDTEIVTFPYVRLTESCDSLPCYTLILNRTTEEGIGMKDLDQLQQEFEKLLSVCAVRSRLLNSEIEYLDRVEDRNERKGKLFDKPPSPKHRKIEEKVKQTKDSKPAYKLLKNFHDEVPKLEIPKIVLPKNDTKSKFWLSVDTYCSPVTGDDSAYLDDLLDEMNENVDLKLSEVGQYYAENWPIDSHQGINLPTYSEKKNTNIINGLFPNNCFFGGEFNSNAVILPLASAFLEENMNKTPGSEDKFKDIGLKSISNGVCLDKRLRNELVELGILDLDDQKMNGKLNTQDDEIAQEIKLCHKELCKLKENNTKELHRLRHAVNKDLSRQEFVRKLDEVDNKIMEIYNKLLTCNPKDRNNLEWEAVRIVKLQKQYHKDAMDMPNLFS